MFPFVHLSDEQLEQVKEVWADHQSWKGSTIVHWTQHPRVKERLNRLVSGDPYTDQFKYFADNYLRLPVKRALTLGCGHGVLERGLAPHNFALKYEGIDISERAIEEAERLAREAGFNNIEYRVDDLNKIQLTRYGYDVIFGISSFHHVSNIEHLIIQVSQALKPGGFLFLDEYIGPDQFQWPDQQLHIINEQIVSMPERFRMSLTPPQIQVGVLERHTLEEMNAVDPSEAIRSTDILPHVRYVFDPVVVKGCGGSLLHLLLEHTAGHFSEDDPESMKLLYSMFELEDRLIASGKLQHDFAVIIAQKKTTIGTWARYCANRLARLVSAT
jgi:2-polyprenyl-3-methyl-5-hydroxy-6-metoxy-1,4-benzoquinol methylase